MRLMVAAGVTLAFLGVAWAVGARLFLEPPSLWAVGMEQHLAADRRQSLHVGLGAVVSLAGVGLLVLAMIIGAWAWAFGRA